MASTDRRWFQVLDEHGQAKLLPFEQALETEKQRGIAQDKDLDICRSRIPIFSIGLPDQPESLDCQRLAIAIRNIAAFKDIAPETRSQAFWMRCVQLYWEAKSIALSNEIYRLIPDPTQPHGPVWKMLPPVALENLKLDIQCDHAWYQMLQVGHTEVEAWATTQGLDYPFDNFEALFIETLKNDFDISFSEEAFSPVLPTRSRKHERDHHRRWIKFFGDHFNGSPEEDTFISLLRSMGWKGYSLLALRGQKRNQQLGKLWQNYLKKNRLLLKFLDSRLYWQNGIPYQATKARNKRTKRKQPIQCIVTDDGYFRWY